MSNMGIPVYILGESGTGKSASLRNFKKEDVKVINVAAKPLPFKNNLECVNVDTYEAILREIKNAKQPSIVVDDAQYIMANEFMRRATERGYDKFTEIAFHMWDIVNEVKELSADKIVYFLSHVDRDSEGNEKVKTIGKLLDEKITLEGMFTIVLKTNVMDGQYSFLTQNSGKDTVKSPIGLFNSYAIDNDLKYVDEKIRNYYELGDYLSDEDIAEIDEAAKTVDFEPKGKGRRSRGAKLPETSANVPMPEVKPPKVETADATPRRRSRAEVQESNAEAVANAGLAEADGTEGVPFDDVEMPEVEKLPRKTRKERTAEVESNTTPETEGETPKRRRKRG